MTTEHTLQSCSKYGDLRKGTWPTPTTMKEKLYGTLADLQTTATFIVESRLDI
jgi:hypothetical protein